MLLVASVPRAHAQSKEPSTIDAVRGTIKGSTRFIGLGGAFVALADDTEGVPINPASAAVRLPYSWDAFGFAFGLDFSVSTWLPKNDIYNAEDEGTGKSGALFGSLAFLVNYRHAGFGLTAEAEQNTVSRQAQGISSKLNANFGLIHAVAAYGFFDGQLQLGAGLRILGFSFDMDRRTTPFTAGVGPVAGVIVKPTGQQFRVGAATEFPINAEIAGEKGTAPLTVKIPWTGSVGFAYQFGTRKLNPAFATASDRASRNGGDADKAAQELFEEYQKDQTWYLLVSTEVALIQVGDDVALGTSEGVDGVLVSPRLGLETEVVPRWLRLRAGTYLELATTEGRNARLHGTGGVDIKLFEWNVFGLVQPFDYWSLSLAVDGAKSYLNTSFSIGFWH
ncbi:MAG TPA: hypothetical protein VJV78_18515 [Polyangiales bacterium]|nr:hypothetical protein [Polyangiales bacterium]